MKWPLLLALATGLSVGLFAPVAFAASGLQIVALSGQPPDTAVSLDRFVRFDAVPVIDNHGNVSFLAGPEVEPGRPFEGSTSVWSQTDDQVTLLARKGDPAPGLPAGVLFDRFFGPVRNDAGQTAFGSLLSGDGVSGANQQALWLQTEGGLRAVARQGEPAPGTEEDTRYVDFVDTPALTDDGRLLFFADIRQGGPSQPLSSGLWFGAPGRVDRVAGADDPAPGTLPGVKFLAQMFESPFGDRPVVNRGGQTALLGFLEGPGVEAETNSGIWRSGRPGPLELVVRNGQQAPDAQAGVDFLSFTSPPALNAAGHVAFLAFVSDPPESNGSLAADHQPAAMNDVGLWSDRDGSMRLVVRQGDAAPGTESGVDFADFDFPIVNARGSVAFGAAVTGENVDPLRESGIWSEGLEGPGHLRLVARSGDPAPGTESGVVFANFLSPALNASGQTAFQATLAGPGVGDSQGNALGLWAEDRRGTLRLLARTGQSIEVAEGDLRTIGFLEFATDTGGEDGRPRGLNDRGELAFRVRFTDGSSAILRSDVAAIPEPSSHQAAVALLGWLSLCGVCRMGYKCRCRRERPFAESDREPLRRPVEQVNRMGR